MQRGNGEMSSGQLLGECSALPADREARPPERIGNGLCRVHLSGTGDWTLAAPLLADLLLLTAAEHHGTAADLEECLTAAEALPLPGMADWRGGVPAVEGCPPVHHSPAYREAYRPPLPGPADSIRRVLPGTAGGGPAGAERQTSRRGH